MIRKTYFGEVKEHFVITAGQPGRLVVFHQYDGCRALKTAKRKLYVEADREPTYLHSKRCEFCF